MDRLELRRIAGLLLGLGGVLFILLPEASLPAAEMRLWVLVGLVVPMCVATSIIACEHYPPPESGRGGIDLRLDAHGGDFLWCRSWRSAGRGGFSKRRWDWADGSVVLAGLIVPMCWAFAFEIIRRAGSVFYSTVTLPRNPRRGGLGHRDIRRASRGVGLDLARAAAGRDRAGQPPGGELRARLTISSRIALPACRRCPRRS